MNYNKTGFALQYDDGKLAAIDKSYGVYSAPGYPYAATSIHSVEVFNTNEEADKVGHGEKLTTVSITIDVSVKDLRVEDIKKVFYQTHTDHYKEVHSEVIDGKFWVHFSHSITHDMISATLNDGKLEVCES